MITKQDIRQGDTVKLAGGATIVVDAVVDSYGDRAGEHPGPWVRTREWDRYLLSQVVDIVARNPRTCRYCGEGVTSTNPDCDYCRNCHYNGTALADEKAAVLAELRAASPRFSVWHTGGGCFAYGAVLSTESDDGEYPFVMVTNGDAGIDGIPGDTVWVAGIYRHDDDEGADLFADGDWTERTLPDIIAELQRQYPQVQP